MAELPGQLPLICVCACGVCVSRVCVVAACPRLPRYLFAGMGKFVFTRIA